MDTMPAIFKHFWLFCGLWVGVGGGIHYWFVLTRERNASAFSKDRAFRYARNYCLAILLPSLSFWLLQLSLPHEAQPFFTKWPSPQGDVAVALMFVCWAVLVAWVNFQGGAKILSEMFKALSPNQSELITSELSMRIFSILVVISGAIAFWLEANAT